MGFDFMFDSMSVIVPVMFVVVIGMILFTVVRGIAQWNKNNHSPVLTVPAKVTGKRTSVSGGGMHHQGDHMVHDSSHTFYYATFQVESGDRMELGLSSQEYAMLAEGDTGRLTFQGTRYQGFDRDRQP